MEETVVYTKPKPARTIDENRQAFGKVREYVGQLQYQSAILEQDIKSAVAQMATLDIEYAKLLEAKPVESEAGAEEHA
jgi:hypothetical protein